MGTTFTQNGNGKAFRVDYPYYGLFGSAQISPCLRQDELVFQCQLLNGTVIHLKKTGGPHWIDVDSNAQTPLSLIIGRSIDDFLKAES